MPDGALRPAGYHATNFTLNVAFPATGLQSCNGALYRASRAIETATRSSDELPVLCATLAPLTSPCASSVTETSATPLVWSARTAAGISGGGGVPTTAAAAFGCAQPAPAAEGTALGAGGGAGVERPALPPSECATAAPLARGLGGARFRGEGVCVRRGGGGVWRATIIVERRTTETASG